MRKVFTVFYQTPCDLTQSNHFRLAVALIVSGRAMWWFQALQHAATMASSFSEMRLAKAFWRRNCQMFSCGLSSAL
jgi:hypothetical protein